MCLEVKSDPDVSVLLKKINGVLVDHCDSHTHTHLIENFPRALPMTIVPPSHTKSADIFPQSTSIGFNFITVV